ncbi:MAG: ATPase, partial [Methanobacteriaceae archaeon]|nr:ATPase [Methanobacteriaceae archaeon]
MTPNNKKEVIKLLKIIGVDTRFISYTPNTIFINNLRFSKFSRKKEETFKKYYPEIEVKRSSLLQKICNHSSKILSQTLKPQDTVLLPEIKDATDELLVIILEPYSRKYGIQFIDYKDKDNYEIDKIVESLTVNIEAYNILSDIFSGEGINFKRHQKEDSIPRIYPFLNVSNEWINSFLEEENIINYPKREYGNLSLEFMEFISKIIPQYKENILKSKDFIQKYHI